MHDLKYVIENQNDVKKNLLKRKIDIHIFEKVIELDEMRKSLIHSTEKKRSEIKQLSKTIGPLIKEKKDVTELTTKVSEIKSKLEDQIQQLDEVKGEQDFLLSSLPNLIADEVPEGGDEDGNLEVKKWAKSPNLISNPKTTWKLPKI